MKRYMAIGIRAVKPHGTLVAVNDLEPLLTDTSRLLADIERAGGPAIAGRDIRRAEHCLPLASIERQLVLCSFLTEETTDPAETRWLVRARRAELARAFSRWFNRTTPPSRDFSGDAQAARATFILAAAFETARLLGACGNLRRQLGTLTFEATHLQVTEGDGQSRLEIVPIAAHLAVPGQRLH
jgi:hypothetical protein